MEEAIVLRALGLSIVDPLKIGAGPKGIIFFALQQDQCLKGVAGKDRCDLSEVALADITTVEEVDPGAFLVENRQLEQGNPLQVEQVGRILKCGDLQSFCLHEFGAEVTLDNGVEGGHDLEESAEKCHEVAVEDAIDEGLDWGLVELALLREHPQKRLQDIVDLEVSELIIRKRAEQVLQVQSPVRDDDKHNQHDPVDRAEGGIIRPSQDEDLH